MNDTETTEPTEQEPTEGPESVQPEPELDPKPKKTVLRCHCCRKKLKMIHFTCKCGHKFCMNHHNPHSHNCQFDYKTAKKQEILDNNPLIHNKMIKI